MASTSTNADASLTEDPYTNMSEKRKQRLAIQNERAVLNKNNSKPLTMVYAAGNNNMIAQVAGVIIGSPEFQRK